MKMKKSDYRWFNEARKEAEQSDFNNVHVGCVIVYKGHVIGQGHNTNKSCPEQKQYNKYRNFNPNPKGKPIIHSTHAEISAIKSIPYPVKQSIYWKDVSIYIYRICVGKDLGYGLSRPCEGCMNAIKDFGIHNIYYTTNDGFAYERVF